MARNKRYLVFFVLAGISLVAFGNAQDISDDPNPSKLAEELSSTDDDVNFAIPAEDDLPLVPEQASPQPASEADEADLSSAQDGEDSLQDNDLQADGLPSVLKRRGPKPRRGPTAKVARDTDRLGPSSSVDEDRGDFSREFQTAPISDREVSNGKDVHELSQGEQPRSSRRTPRTARSEFLPKFTRQNEVPGLENTKERKQATSNSFRESLDEVDGEFDESIGGEERVSEGTAPQDGIFLESSAPSIRVEVVGTDAMTVGKDSRFRFTAINMGRLPANGLKVRIALPMWVKLSAADGSAGEIKTETNNQTSRDVIWHLDWLPSGARETLDCDLRPEVNEPFDLAVDWRLASVSAVSRIEVQQPELELTVAGPSDVNLGDSKIYKIIISNLGNGDAENVAVSLGPGATGANGQQLGTIRAGESEELEVELTAREAGEMEIQATVVADGGVRQENSILIRVRSADLKVELAAPRLKYAGTVATYLVRITNEGDATASDVVGSVSLPSDANYLGGITGATTTADRLDWRIGNLEAGDERTFKVRCQLNSDGENQFAVQVRDDNDLTSIQTAVTQVKALADLKLSVNDPAGPTPVGEEAVYEIKLVNRGSKAAQNINIVAQFSEGIEPTEALGQTAEIVPGQVIFDAIEELGPGDTIMVKVIAVAADEGNHRFRAEIRSELPETRLVAEEATRYFEP